jgi:hypothetical protein
MWGTEGRSRKAIPLRVVPARGQVPENSSHPSSKEAWDVLHEYVSGSKFANKTGEVMPKSALLPVNPGTASNDTDVLAGKSSGENIDSSWGSKRLYVFVDRYAGPVFGEDAAAPGVGFALPGDVHPGAFESEVDAADAAEKASDIHASSRYLRSSRIARSGLKYASMSRSAQSGWPIL